MRIAALLTLLVGLAGCDLVPTELPRYDTVWEVTMVRDSVRTVDLLPDEMSVDERGFVLDGWTFDRSVRLDEVCELCTCFEGPIPELELEPTDWRVQLPGGLYSATLDGGTARLALTNRMGFDLLLSGAGRRGVLRVELVDVGFGGGVIATRESTASFPTDSTLTVEFDLAGVRLTPNLVARISGTTPGSTCENLSLDPQDGLEAFVELEDVVTRSAQVILQDADLRIDPATLDVPDFVADRLRPGDAELVTEVRVSSSLPAAVELRVSVAKDRTLLQSEDAALTTPIDLAASVGGAPVRFARSFVLDVGDLADLDELHFESLNRVVGNPIVTLTGGEVVTWEVALRASLPSR